MELRDDTGAFSISATSNDVDDNGIIAVFMPVLSL